MTRTHGRAPRGQRLIGRVPHGRWTTMTFLAGLRVQGIIAPCVIDGPINGPMFLACAHRLLLPPYSPDLNPIEQAFAKLKTLLRSADQRSTDAVWKRIGSLLDEFSSDECARYIRHAGYGST
jgi:hypothetical protein